MEWLAYFRQNRLDRMPVAWDVPVDVPVPVRGAVAKSLARFQLGESSDGRRLWRLAGRTGDDAYAQAIELFIGEEQEHARLLGCVLDRLEAPRLRRHWSDWLFRRCRHTLGLYEEIAVLLMAEIVALKYYSVVWNGTGDTAIQRVCEQVLHDEKFHVRFHCEHLHRRITRMPAAVAVGLTAMFAGASALVAWDHRDALVALGSSPEDFLADSWENFAAARQAIVTGQPFVWSRTLPRVESPALPARRRTMQWMEAWSFGRAVALCGWRAVRSADYRPMTW